MYTESIIAEVNSPGNTTLPAPLDCSLKASSNCHNPIFRSFSYAVSVLTLLLVSGCVSLGTPVDRIPLPDGAPPVDAVLTSLAENEAAMRSFRASGTIMVQIPEIEATQISRESSLLYEAPNRLNIVGRRYGTRGIELTYVDDAFILEFPTRKEYCYRKNEESFETLTSADIVREMFRPENWTDLSSDAVRMTSFDQDSQTAELEIWTPGPRSWRKRVLTVQGAPWVLLENTLFTEDGAIIAHTTKAAYHEQDGIRYPTEIESTFPGEEAWMRFLMRRVDINLELDAAVFDLPKRVKNLKRSDFAQVDIFAGEGPSVEELNAEE